MNAGLPSSGIGGLFYFLSTFLMVGVEIVLTVRGKSSRKRWQYVAKQFFLTLSMVAALWCTSWGIKQTIAGAKHTTTAGIATTGIYTIIPPSLSPWIYLVPFLTLLTLIVLTQFLRLIFKIRAAYRFRPPIQ